MDLDTLAVAFGAAFFNTILGRVLGIDWKQYPQWKVMLVKFSYLFFGGLIGYTFR